MADPGVFVFLQELFYPARHAQAHHWMVCAAYHGTMLRNWYYHTWKNYVFHLRPSVRRGRLWRRAKGVVPSPALGSLPDVAYVCILAALAGLQSGREQLAQRMRFALVDKATYNAHVAVEGWGFWPMA